MDKMELYTYLLAIKSEILPYFQVSKRIHSRILQTLFVPQSTFYVSS